MHKKLLLFSVFFLLLSACNNNTSNISSEEQQPSTTTMITTPTENTTTVITTTITTSIADSEIEIPQKNWSIKYYVDQFGDIDYNAPYISSDLLDGTFSNSATTDSPLKAIFLYDEDVAIKLYEYGDNEVKNSFSSDVKYRVIFKFESGSTSTYLAKMKSGSGDRIILSDFKGSKGEEIVLNHFCNGEIIKVFIEEIDSPICNYLFKVDGNGFKETLEEFKTNS